MRFIGERVDAVFEGRSGFAKRPECPDGFRWDSEGYRIEECLREWKDYARRGKMAHNMRPSHLAAAEKRGSRGVGRHYFRVRVSGGRVFDLYFDRAPESALHRGGGWYLLREVGPGETELPATD